MTAIPRFELYGFWRSSATYRVRVALNLKGLHASERLVDLDTGQQRDPAFLAVNPMGALPALVPDDGGPALTQSLAILEYLDEVAPAPPLLPADPRGRARVRAIAGMLTADTHPLIVPRVKKYLTGPGGFDDAAWRAWQVRWFGAGLTAVEARLAHDGATGDYCHGDAVTMADICLASIAAVTRVFGIVVPNIPTIDRILARCDGQDAFARADPRKQEGASS